MKEINTCPVCGAICNPDTDVCLACEEIHHNLLTGGTLKLGQLAWYTLPVEIVDGKRASLTFYGTPVLTVEPDPLKIPFNSNTLKISSLQECSLVFNFIPREIEGTTRVFTMIVQDE